MIKRIKEIDWENLKTYLWIIFFCIFFIYILCMFIFPWIEHRSWIKVQKVWHSWQSLNVGIIALSSSLVALYVVKFSEISRRRIEYNLARHMLAISADKITRDMVNIGKKLIKKLNNNDCVEIDSAKINIEDEIILNFLNYIR
ncbi:hypothetical protein VQ643_15990, partial [Pseudomonas sp. F1_0610]|uniref:hypothetical protein n=1 Tax=Pseudomonas sp. F1_0610 TaxID=3114284 RepID=UPI0039C19E8D